MSFLLYENREVNGKSVLYSLNNNYSLAGYNLIYKAWQLRGKPVNQGWHVDANELIRIHTDNEHDYSTRRLIIDFDPTAKKRIGLVELSDVFAYTYGDDVSGQVYWTPLMLKLRDTFYKEYSDTISIESKQQAINEIEVHDTIDEIVEFLYLNGDSMGWNWGTNGRTAAAFLYREAREYFRQYF